jgi:hypothetical protein
MRECSLRPFKQFLHRWSRLIVSIVASLSLLLIAGCSQNAPRQVTTAFYYWRTRFAPGPEEVEYLRAANVQQLYVRFFDVDWDFGRNSPIPVAPIEASGETTPCREVIPTVFITNRAMENARPADIEDLGVLIARGVIAIRDKSFRHTLVREVQLDCDWTPQTRQRYFDLIKSLRSHLPPDLTELSATIRLHQIKYRSVTGIPPVDKGVLMFYNNGKFADPRAINSILDLGTAQQYVNYIDDYPLRLDVALPLYSWGVVFRRGRVVDLLEEADERDFSDTSRFLRSARNIDVTRSTFWNYTYLYEGDRIRFESVSQTQLASAVGLIRRHIHSDSLRVIFFHLDSEIVRQFPNEDLQTLCAAFR